MGHFLNYRDCHYPPGDNKSVCCRTNEGGRKKCGQYWPLEEGGQEVYSHMAVVNQRVDNHSHYSQTTLELYNMEVQ